MPAINAQVSRYIDDEPQPGIVECVLIDALGQSHFFIQKTAIVSNETLLEASAYPTPCEIACEVEAEWNDQAGNSLARVCTELPWHIESTTGQTVFVVHQSQIVRSEAPAA